MKNISIKLCAILLTSQTIYAQEITRLEEITISEQAYSKYQNEAKPELNRTQISKEDTAKSIQTFNKTFIEDAQLQNIEDIIEMSSNTVYTGDNHGRTNEISMRGFAGVPILFDGLKLTNKLAHSEVYNLESVEVLKGPDSLQYGQSSPGGLVNLVTKKPTKDSLAKIEFEVTDNPSYSPKLDVGGALNENKSLYFRLSSVLKYDEGWTNSNTDINRVFIAPSLAYDINDNNVITFVTEYTDEKTPSSFGTYVDNNGKLVTDIKNILSSPDEEFKKTQKIAGFDFDTIYDTWNSSFKYRYIDYVGDNGNVHISTLGYNKPTNSVNRFYAYQKQEFQEHALQYTLNKEVDIFNLKNRFTIGADYNKSYSKLDFFSARPPLYPLYLSNLVYEPLTSLNDHPNAINMSSPKTDIENYGIFLQDNINITDDLIFSAGVRYDEVKPKNSQKSDATTPQFGLVYHLTPQTTLFTNYSESFTPTSRQDKDGKILNPEKGKGYEFGVKQKLFDDSFDLTTSLFKIEKDNVAVLDLANSGGTFVYKQSGIQTSQGFELDLNGDITSNWSIIASYGYVNTKDKDINNNELRNIPHHTANLFTTYKLTALNLPDYYIGGGARYIGSRYANDTNSIELDSALIYNATIGYKKGNWKANLSVQNLSNEKYVDGAINNGTAGGYEWARVYVGTPRTILASISYTF
ncbi:TonB-dependent siderophore receptor [Aliarcobacter faecis]|uniref:TonB-dependent siderophore receptor n=1 Tax=Aliarcobacter faecis TaxID=1564138 RepID=UPI0004B83B95|nr:TonB-dependent receptor [Aliarcobacter faecis]QKF72508.1 TonB-dependent siderophore receptor [Aliarcobacter faecis]